MFSAKEKQIVEHLVAQLGKTNLDVGAESAKALVKFVCKDNYNRVEHCKAIVEFDGVPKLMNLIRRDNREESGLDEVILLCNLVVNAGNSKALKEARALNVIEGAKE
ncbi:hypothetical protein BUALT_Bualt12G0068700 [Buddleja alternifolia]|uniref:Uncharacterized protein n=1 Tax=Buddleja alternifolia TaxID=168488 RepID=A0AAV6WVH5_9LAMI|nr:hypothetical protein BUALT_Bualt12G0068700 [Buddleja alternifolia]